MEFTRNQRLNLLQVSINLESQLLFVPLHHRVSMSLVCKCENRYIHVLIEISGLMNYCSNSIRNQENYLKTDHYHILHQFIDHHYNSIFQFEISESKLLIVFWFCLIIMFEQAEKELQVNKAQILASKHATIQSIERRCLMLEQKIAAQNLKITILRSNIDDLDSKYHSYIQQLRLNHS